MDSPTIKIASELENIERNRRIEFSIKGEGLIIDYLSISSRVAEIGFVAGIVNSIDIPQAIRELTIDGIISGLKSRKIQSNKEYNFREFDKAYLKNLWDKEITTSSQELKEIIDENMQINQLGGFTTEGADYQMKEDSEYVTMESAPLKKQEFDFASSKAITQEINDVINEIKESNASDRITPEDISHFGHNSKEVLEYPIFNSTDVEGPKLPEINGGQYIGIAGIAGGILGGVLAVAFAGLGYFVWHRKNREGSYDVEKAMKNLPEQAQLEHSGSTSEIESLLSNATSAEHLSSQISTEY
ncbi:uncharacterized protein TNCT_526351 [Trichonephila clavata]|uniref:Uncharacterized protein n=1 Tax=Trichonephila clavata TaxID=2740835 RepID=A0A8X6LRF5_TRICU|nr:uncharacterized protein TNCT_526351 [Trichonephila clavata]